jgi:hypothetical protein
MFIAVEGAWLAIMAEIAFCRLAIPEKALTLDKQQLHQLPRGIIDEHQEYALRSTPFEPVMF